MTPTFDSGGRDETTFAPFILEDARNSEFQDVRLEFSDWDWLHDFCNGESIGDYVLDGPGVEGLVIATRFLNGLEAEPESMEANSEDSTCYIHFTSIEDAVQTARLSAVMIKDKKKIRKAAAIAEEHGFGG